MKNNWFFDLFLYSYQTLNDAYQNSGHKRSALLLDKLMYALQKAIDEKEDNGVAGSLEVPAQGPSSRDSSSEVSFFKCDGAKLR